MFLSTSGTGTRKSLIQSTVMIKFYVIMRLPHPRRHFKTACWCCSALERWSTYKRNIFSAPDGRGLNLIHCTSTDISSLSSFMPIYFLLFSARWSHQNVLICFCAVFQLLFTFTFSPYFTDCCVARPSQLVCSLTLTNFDSDWLPCNRYVTGRDGIN